MLEPGRRAWLNYGFGEWYERLVLDVVQGTEHYVATPDFEIYVEQMDGSNVDLVAFRLGPVGGGPPVGVPGPNEVLYTFTNLNAGQESALIAEGKELARRERQVRGLIGPAGPAVGGAGEKMQKLHGATQSFLDEKN